MSYRKSTEKLAALRSKILELRSEMRDVQAHIEPDPVADHTFETITGKVQLSELFGTHKDLFVVHNMGASCSYCTLWADGYNGLVPHIESRAAFVVVSPDKPAAQAAFAKKRGWGFRLVSDPDSGFAKAMDYYSKGHCQPGVSVLQRDGEHIVRVSDQQLGPYDDFCAVWHLFDMLPGGAGDWSPRKS